MNSTEHLDDDVLISFWHDAPNHTKNKHLGHDFISLSSKSVEKWTPEECMNYSRHDTNAPCHAIDWLTTYAPF